MRLLSKRIRGHEGQALIEFALVAPILLILIFAIFDVAKALNYLNDETNLANSSARLATVAASWASSTDLPSCNGSSTSNLYEYVVCEAGQDSGSFASNLGVCVVDENGATTDPSTFNAGDPIKVILVYPYNFLSEVSRVVGHPSVTLTSSATMVAESAISSTNTATGWGWVTGADTDASNPFDESGNPLDGKCGTSGYE